MLARRELPDRYVEWNAARGAPLGRPVARFVPDRVKRWPGVARAVGMFAFQTNTTTRAFEYPWAFEAIGPTAGMSVVEVGGSNSGFQFALAQAGCRVTNVDPGDEARGRGWSVTPASIATLNRRFGTDVELRNCFIEQAGLADESFDRAVSISTIEHIPPDDIATIVRELHRVLRPGGLFVMTLDLFLDLVPFTDVEANAYGSNVSVRWMSELADFELVHGDRRELYGFDEFDADAVLARRDEFLEGTAMPQLVQTVILAKR